MSKSNKLIASALLAGALAMSASSSAIASEKEKCYGITKAGKNDCAANNHSCAGHSKTDYDSNDWKFVDKGTCESTEVTLQDGTKKKGSLKKPS